MGLTIHYRLTTDRTKVEEIRALVHEIRRLALHLPFAEVEEVVEFEGDQCRFDNPDDPHRWLKIQAGQYLRDGNIRRKVLPLHVIAFTAFPGEGSEPANIGFGRYPQFVDVEERGRKQRLRTKLTGWSWGSFCKTQYASDPAYGGVPHFVRCHLCIVALLDAVQNRQLAQVQVNDEGDYWNHRDVRKLVDNVGEWNDAAAAIAAQIKDAVAGMTAETPSQARQA